MDDCFFIPRETIAILQYIRELKEELEEEKRINVEDLKTIDRQQEIIQELRNNWNKLKDIIGKEIFDCSSGEIDQEMWLSSELLEKMQELESWCSDEQRSKMYDSRRNICIFNKG